MKITTLAVAVLPVLLVGCARLVPFTKDDRLQHQLTTTRIQNLQFFTSETIILERDQEDVARVQNGKLYADVDRSERIIIRQKTPGLVNYVAHNFVGVNFEADPAATLYFVEAPAAGGIYVLGSTTNQTHVVYGDHCYRIVQGDAHLLFNRQHLTRESHDHVAAGRQLPHYNWLRRALETPLNVKPVDGGRIGDAATIEGQQQLENTTCVPRQN